MGASREERTDAIKITSGAKSGTYIIAIMDGYSLPELDDDHVISQLRKIDPGIDRFFSDGSENERDKTQDNMS